jgi:phage shock protein C
MTYSSNNRTLYRSRHGWVFGVCQGLSNYLDISAFWIRIATVIAVMLSGFFPMVLIYIVAAIFLRPAPIVQPSSPEDWEFYQTYSSDRKVAMHMLKRKLDSLDKRTRRMENVVTDKHFDWQRRFDAGS